MSDIMQLDLYAILGVEIGATEKEVYLLLIFNLIFIHNYYKTILKIARYYNDHHNDYNII